MVKINRKILFLILAIFLLLALFFNVNNFIGFFYNALWNYNYNREDYKNAINYHKKAENKINQNTINYNLWWDYYKLWDYTKAREYYEKIKTGTWEKEDFEMDYNLWNAFYKLWEVDPDIENKINLWKQSLGNYKKILDQKEDKKTRQNYDFVMKKLKSLEDNKEKQEKQEEQQKDETSEDEKSSQENQDGQKEGKNEQSQDKKESDNKEWEKKQDENSTAENKSWQGNPYDIKKDSKLKELTEEEKRQLEEYNEQLKQEQKENGELFWKKSQWNNSKDIFDMLNQDPLFGNFESFDDSILNSNEKDW